MVSIREYVGHLPVEQRELLAAPARLLPPKALYGPVYESTYRDIRKARTVPWWSRQEVARRLSETLTTARRAPYYSEGSAYRVLERVARGELGAHEGLRSLPILTRRDVTDHNRDMLVVDESHVEISGTSGTSGEPVRFFLDRNRGAREWSYVVDAWSDSGYELGQWRAFFRGQTLSRDRSFILMPSIRELLIRLQAVQPESIRMFWNIIEKRKIHFLHGYASSLLYLTQLIEESNFDTSWRHEIRGLFPVSEQFTVAQEERLRRVFPKAVISVFYGLSEKTAFARMDRDHDYHTYPLYGYVELLDPEGTRVGVGERGRVVTTSLDGRGMPLLRYDTGDSAEFIRREPNGSVVFKDILSRRGREGLVRADGKMFSLTSYGFDGDEFPLIRRFKLRQEVPGKAVLQVQPAPAASESDIAEFFREMSLRGEHHVELELEVIDRFEPTASGKEVMLDQRIPDAPTTWA